MPDSKVTFQEIKDKISEFVHKRDWDQYHSPKNLSMSLAIEAAELMEHFQWLINEQSNELKNDPVKKTELAQEMADVGVYLLNLSNVLGIDISKAIKDKMEKNDRKYPAKLVKGKAHKYTHYIQG